jgi:hypothetical protein
MKRCKNIGRARPVSVCLALATQEAEAGGLLTGV